LPELVYYDVGLEIPSEHTRPVVAM